MPFTFVRAFSSYRPAWRLRLLSIGAGAALAGLGLGGAAAAQTTPATPRAASPLGTSSELSLHVSVSATDSWSVNRPPSGAIGLRAFDTDNATPRIDLAAVSFERGAPRPGQLGFRVDFGAGWTVPRVSAARGLFRDTTTGEAGHLDLLQAYLSYLAPVGRGLRIDAGKFLAPVGGEALELWDHREDEISRSLLFTFAEPLSFTGVRATYAWSPRVSASGLVVQGWDAFLDNNRGKTIAGVLTVVPARRVTIALGVVSGPELTNDTRDRRLLIDLVAAWQPDARTQVGLTLDSAGEPHGAPGGGHADWHGAAVSVHRALTDRVTIGVRGELFHDTNGARTGTPQKVGEFTGAATWTFGGHLALRGEFRIDRSGVPVFDSSTGPTRVQRTVAGNAFVTF